MCNSSTKKQIEIFMKGTFFADEVIDDVKNKINRTNSLREQAQKELSKKLQKKKSLNIYYGIDPTSSSLHVGHFVPIQKLKKLQDLGHKVTFLIGDYTATIGDPSEQIGERRRFTHEQILCFAERYTEFAFKVLDREKTTVKFNSSWLSKLTFADIIELACIFPLKQIISRRDFQKRMDRGESLRLHEALYSLMQGYDAYILKADVQVAGYDQHFNLLAGRAIQEHFKNEPHVMLTNSLIMGTDGRKMSKSYNNAINLDDDPFDMYGKAMRIGDSYLVDYLELTSSLPTKEIDELIFSLNNNRNPMEIKKRLAFNLVEQYHSKSEAKKAEDKFYQMIQKKNAPKDIKLLKIPADYNYLEKTWLDFCYSQSLAKSKGEMRRLMQQGAFYVNQKQEKDINSKVNLANEEITIRVGKRNYYKLIVEK